MIAALHAAVRDLHPVFERLYPIGVAHGDRLLVYDTASGSSEYRLACRTVVPLPILEQTRVTVPLAEYGSRPVCVVTPDVFDTVGSCVSVFHEFVHCAQWETCEPDLGARIASAHPEVTHIGVWEVRHPFRYGNERMVSSYRRMLTALAVGDLAEALRWHADSGISLSPIDRDYMVWLEWKEGFARWLEGRVRRRLRLQRRQSGPVAFFGREIFHAGGAELVNLLVRSDPKLACELPELYHTIRGASGAEPVESSEPPSATDATDCHGRFARDFDRPGTVLTQV